MKPILLVLAMAGALAAPLVKLTPSEPVVAGPLAPDMTKEGLELVLDFEVSGKDAYLRWPRPEYIGDHNSGVTWGIGYDAHYNSVSNILRDWNRLGTIPARRLSAVQPYFGKGARNPAASVKDIIVPWDPAVKVFLEVDLARVDASCRRTFARFDELRPHAKDALRSLVFNRGTSMSGPSRGEMRAIRDMVPKRDYAGMAEQEKRMIHLWRGTTIEKGMTRRRYAEAQLFLTPDT